mmetsp:Transcript_30585/g.96490  ORF Transcript_30585/g.96490 Transcript_30585/m.96490 type:complete len:227 (+) Transcript_30585:1212-1892(+)
MEARLGEVEQARRVYSDGLRSCRGHAPLWQAAARLEKEAGEADRARRMLRAGLRDCAAGERVEGAGGGGGGGDDGLLLSWAALELGEGRLAQAQQLLERARAAGGGGGGRTHQLQAVLLARQGLAADARAALREGLRAAPGHAPLHTLLGSMLDADNDVEGARAAFREALRLQPGDGRTFHAWARLEARLLNWEGLRLLNEQAQQVFPPSRGGAVGGVSFPDDVVV